MFVQAVTLASVRNYERLSVEFSPGLNLMHGDNAAGKTNLLEAVFYAASLRSFRGAKAADIVSWGRDECRITAKAMPGQGGTRHTLSVSLGGTGRRISLDGKKPESVSEYLLTLKPSGFSPEDLFLVREYPSHRRRFVDRSVFHLEPGFIALANRYRQAVSQLNAALKSGDHKVSETYELTMAPLAAGVLVKRAAYLARLGPLAARVYREILGGGDLGLEYRGGPASRGTEGAVLVDGEADAATLEKMYIERLAAKRAEGMKRGYTSVGPHTDDITVTLDGRDVRTSASRGQGRLAYLALVLADAGLYRDVTGKAPVLLLDDVISELDDTRAGGLMDYVSGMGQVILTATDDRVARGRDCRTFLVEGGHVNKAGV